MKDLTQSYGPVLREGKRAPSPVFQYLKHWWGVPLALICFGLLMALRPFPHVTERFFSRGWYLFAARTFGFLTSLFPFSLLEMLIIGGSAAVLFFLTWSIASLVMTKNPRLLTTTLRHCVNVAGTLFAIFVLTCAPNYSRHTFSSYSGLEVRPSSAQELYSLCLSLAKEATALRANLPQNQEGVFLLEQSMGDLSKESRDVFNQLSETYDVLPALSIRPKPVMASYVMSMGQITGCFSPVTMEANINTHAPDYTIPATACHELAHTRGFMREDEANFIAYLACKNTDDPVFRYSGVMLGLVHAHNRLYGENKDLYRAVAETMSPEVLRDFSANNAYWAEFEGPVATVSTAVNNAYLKANDQSDGVKSYGRMVDLLLAEHRQTKA